MNEMASAMKQGGGRMTMWGILTVILGFLAMSSPLIAGISVATVVGLLLTVGGVTRMLWAFGSDSFGQGALKFGIGVLTLLCGLVMVSRPLFALGSLTLILAIYFILDGLFEIIAAFGLKPESGWGYLLFSGIVSLALGVMIWRQFPLSGAWAIGILVGVKLLFGGLQMLTVGSLMKSAGGMAGATDEEE